MATTDGSSANLLRFESSPYLLQHANNPVHWRPWGLAALDEAKTANKPILLSIGYAACHWCHVMAHESFEDAETAALMNRLFVNIKVDREERPDIDHLYMSALHALGDQGGWPLTMFLTPDGTPFWGGTYFPPEPRWGKPSLRQVLQATATVWQAQDESVTHNTAALRQAVQRLSTPEPGDLPTPQHLDAVAAAYLRLNDPEHGGLRGAPKFPNAPIFRFLWQNAFRTGDPGGKKALHLMLTRMSQGGIYDHLGGGFARYSTDHVWLVPHFEKMLYDNGQLFELLAYAHADRPDPLYAARVAETVGWLLRDMRTGNAFAASEDADSEGQEGKFYVWTEQEIDTLLGPDSAAFKAAYDVTRTGNWEGHTILRRMTPPGPPVKEDRLARCRQIVFRARAKRVRPGRDDKVLADWNGLAITGLARAACVFRQPEWLAAAETAFDFIIRELAASDGRVNHAWRLGRVTAAGLLDDQASMARAALALYEATGNPHRLTQAVQLAQAALDHFCDGAGAFYTTADEAADVPLTRPRTAADSASPSANGMLAEVFARLWHLTGDTAWRAHAEALLCAFSGKPDQMVGQPTLLAAADLLQEGASVVIIGDGEGAGPLIATALAAPDPAITVLRAPDPGQVSANHPAHGKAATPVGAAAYVCRRQTCSLPVSESADLAGMLAHRSTS
jgi:uncharacterized protein YyaL (SSP411 family)